MVHKLPEDLSTALLGAIGGDIIGSTFERCKMVGDQFNTVVCSGYDKEVRVDRSGEKAANFELFTEGSRFTDDTVLTVAVMEWLLEQADKPFYSTNRLIEIIKQYVVNYSDRGFGKMFKAWAAMKDFTFNSSWGNGAAMRVSPVAFVSDESSINFKHLAELSAVVTHSHDEGRLGALAIALAVYKANRTPRFYNDEARKELVLDHVSNYCYELRTLDEARKNIQFSSAAKDTVPLALSAFKEGVNYEDTIRKAISLGGDSDTIASMAGAIAAPFYEEGIPVEIAEKIWQTLDDNLRDVILRFNKRFILGEED